MAVTRRSLLTDEITAIAAKDALLVLHGARSLPSRSVRFDRSARFSGTRSCCLRGRIFRRRASFFKERTGVEVSY